MAGEPCLFRHVKMKSRLAGEVVNPVTLPGANDLADD